jgi:uncharacterized membrane protein YgcG
MPHHFRRLAALCALGAILGLTVAVTVRAAGPPFPSPVPGQRVYDAAGVLSAATVAEAEAAIRRIEDRSGAQVVVYTQVKPGSTGTSTEEDAAALGTSWGVGQAGFDDGLVILVNYDADRVHGNVALVGGAGFQAVFLDDAATQQIIDVAMLPRLKAGDPDGAILAALVEVEAGTTPEAADRLRTARQVNAVIGLVGAPLAFLLLAGWAFFHWWRFGRDPVYLDSPSIYLPAPPPALTPATGALVYEGSTTRRALTAALLDLASRDEIAFVKRVVDFGPDEVEIEIRDPDERDPRVSLNRRAPLGPAEDRTLRTMRTAAWQEGGRRVLGKDELREFGQKVDTINSRLEEHAVTGGWFREPPNKVRNRWYGLAGIEFVVAVGVFWLAGMLPSDGLMLVALGVGAAAIVTAILAYSMPARTMAGAMIRAMLAAYQRTLRATLESARSLTEVVAKPELAWLETPDRAVAWGVALGLHGEIQAVMERSVDPDWVIRT